MEIVCPQCGNTDSGHQFSKERMCWECGTRVMPPTPLWERLIFSLVFFVPGLVFGIVGIGLALIAADARASQGSSILVGLSSGANIIALVCLIQGVRELIGRGKTASRRRVADSPGLSLQEDELLEVLLCPPLVPQREAEELVREFAEKHGAKRILQNLEHLPLEHVENTVAHFAQSMDDDETPLGLIDTSFLGNGKAGFLLTNRGLYSSFCSRPLWLADINDVSYATPGFDRYFFLYLLIAGHIVCAYLGGMLGAVAGSLLSQLDLPARPFSLFWSTLSLLLLLCSGIYVSSGSRQLQNRLLVNGKTICRGKRLRGAFWIELLKELAEAARHVQITGGDRKRKPRLVVLETALPVQEYEADELRQIRDPSWEEVEQSIRTLDQDGHPSLRIWAGEVDKSPALEILGGNGKYVLRELGDSWTYYDPSASEEEVQVCKGSSDYRTPAFYVCTDLQRVLAIARHYVETGTPE